MSFQTAAAAAIAAPGTSATVIHGIVRHLYGDEVYDRDPLTVFMDLHDDVGAEADPNVMDRWNAVQILMADDAVFHNFHAFHAVAASMDDGNPFFETFDPLSVEEAAWALLEMSLQRDMLPFGHGIRTYLKTILELDGYGDEEIPPVFHAVFRGDDPSLGKHLKLGAPNAPALQDYLDARLDELEAQAANFPEIDFSKVLESPKISVDDL